MVSYLRDSPMDLETALAGIVGDIIIVKDEVGNVYLPSVLNGIGNLQPGKGYQIKMAAPATLTYPPN